VTKKIRILQLHNLYLCLEGSPFTRSLLDIRGLRNIDYLVVCGNFTQDRSVESFRHAEDVLRELVLKVLPDRVANRVVLVPGPLDVPDPDADRPDFKAFQLFYERFFQEEFGVAKTFDPQQAELRDLKDLTLIGLTYWKSVDPEVSRNRMRSFGEALGGAIRSMSSLAYVKSTPTLLISAGTPLFPNGEEWPAANPDIHKAFNTNPQITFHLFGAGALENVAPVPFSYDHVSLGLSSGDLWPLRVNLIELDTEPTSDRRLGANWTALRQRASGEAWEKRTYEAKMVPRLEPQKLYGDFLKQLANSMIKEDTQMIHLQGFPGSGILDVFTMLKRERLQIGGLQVCIHDHRWKNEADFIKFLDGLDSGGAAVVGRAVHLIVLYHPNFYHIASELMKDHIEKILESCQAFFFQGFKLLYLTGFSDCTFFVEGRDELRFVALDETSTVPDLLQHYVNRVPLHSSQVTDLTGGYAGFSQSFLRGCEDTFSIWKGAQDVDNWSSAILLRDSFASGSIRETCRRFLECVRKIGDGPQVFDYVRKQVLDHYEKEDIGHSSSFGRPEVEGMPYSETWRHMANYQVLDRIGSSNRYRVRVAAPFLGQRSVRVFFSYFSKDKGYIQLIRSLLEDLGEKEKTRVEIFEYLAEDRIFEEAASVKEELAKHLTQFRNLCVFQLDRGISPMVEYEIEFWAKKWGWPAAKNCRRIVLVPNYDSLLPGFLQGADNAVIPVKERTPKEVVAELFRRLDPEELKWGFDLKGAWAHSYPDERTNGR